MNMSFGIYNKASGVFKWLNWLYKKLDLRYGLY